MMLVHAIPVYWGIETQPADRTLVTRATLHEVLPPYRLSTHAFRVRISPWHWLHLGTYRFDQDAVGRYGLEALPEDIRRWRGRVQTEDGDTAESADQGDVPEALTGGSVHGAG